MNVYNFEQFVSQEFCLSCLGCCRFKSSPSIWAPNLLQKEKQSLNIEEIELKEYKYLCICCFLNPENNHCGLYARRPFECRLYPFLIIRRDSKLYLGVDCNCPVVSQKRLSSEFKQYADYLVKYFQYPINLSILEENSTFFSSYPDTEILILTELML